MAQVIPPPPAPLLPPPPGIGVIDVPGPGPGPGPGPRGPGPQGGQPPIVGIPHQDRGFWPEVFPIVYRGWVLRKAIPEPGQRYNWDRVQVNEFHVRVADMAAKNRETRWKKSVTKVYDELRTDTQRMHIDNLVREQNRKEENPFAEWRLANIEVRYRDIKLGILQKATETNQIRVILKKVPRGALGARLFGEPQEVIRDVNDELERPPLNQPLPPPPIGPQPLGLGVGPAGPPPIMGGPPGPQVGKGGGKGGNQGKPGGKDGKGDKNDKNNAHRSRSESRENKRRNKLIDGMAEYFKEVGMIESSSSSSESDSEDSILMIEDGRRKNKKKSKKHGSRSRSRASTRGRIRPRMPLPLPQPGYEYTMAGVLPARGRSRTREEEYHRVKTTNGLRGGGTRVRRWSSERYGGSSDESWEEIGSSASESRSYRSTPPSSVGGSTRYARSYRERSASRGTRRSGFLKSALRNRSTSRPGSAHNYDRRGRPPSISRSDFGSSSSDDSFRSKRTTKSGTTKTEVHHHHYASPPSSTSSQGFGYKNPNQRPPPNQALTYPNGQYPQQGYIPPSAPTAPQGTYANPLLQPGYVQQGVRANDYMTQQDRRASYPPSNVNGYAPSQHSNSPRATPREVAEAYERGREKQREIDEDREMRRRLSDMRQEESERRANIERLKNRERDAIYDTGYPPDRYDRYDDPYRYRHAGRPRSTSRNRWGRLSY